MTVFGTEWIAELLHLHMESVCTVFIRCTVFTRCIVFTRCTVVTGAYFYRASVFYRVHSFYRVHAFKGLVFFTGCTAFTGCTRSLLAVVVYLLYFVTWKWKTFHIQTFVFCKPWKLPKGRSLVHVGLSGQLLNQAVCVVWLNVPCEETSQTEWQWNLTLTLQLYCQVSIQLLKECFVMPSTLITHSRQSLNISRLQQQTNIWVKSEQCWLHVIFFDCVRHCGP